MPIQQVSSGAPVQVPSHFGKVPLAPFAGCEAEQPSAAQNPPTPVGYRCRGRGAFVRRPRKRRLLPGQTRNPPFPTVRMCLTILNSCRADLRQQVEYSIIRAVSALLHLSSGYGSHHQFANITWQHLEDTPLVTVDQKKPQDTNADADYTRVRLLSSTSCKSRYVGYKTSNRSTRATSAQHGAAERCLK